MNILFFLTPKASCDVLYDDESVRESLQNLDILFQEVADNLDEMLIDTENVVESPVYPDVHPLWEFEGEC